MDSVIRPPGFLPGAPETGAGTGRKAEKAPAGTEEVVTVPDQSGVMDPDEVVSSFPML